MPTQSNPQSFFRLRFYYTIIAVCICLGLWGEAKPGSPYLLICLGLAAPCTLLGILSCFARLRSLAGGAAIGSGIVYLLLLAVWALLLLWSKAWGTTISELAVPLTVVAILASLMLVVDGFIAARRSGQPAVASVGAVLSFLIIPIWTYSFVTHLEQMTSTHGRKQQAHHEAALATVQQAEACLLTYSSEHDEKGFPTTLKELGTRPGCPTGNSWIANSYSFSYQPHSTVTPVTQFTIVGKPLDGYAGTTDISAGADERGVMSVFYSNPVLELKRTYRCVLLYRYQDDARNYPRSLYEANEVRDKYDNPCLDLLGSAENKDKETLKSNEVRWSFRNYVITYAPRTEGDRVAGFVLQARPIRWGARPGTFRSYYADETVPLFHGTPYDRAATATDPVIPRCEEMLGGHCFYPGDMSAVAEPFSVPKDPDTGIAAEVHPQIVSIRRVAAQPVEKGGLGHSISVKYTLDGDLALVRDARLELRGTGKSFDAIPVAIASAGEAVIPAPTVVPLSDAARQLQLRLVVVYSDKSESRVSATITP